MIIIKVGKSRYGHHEIFQQQFYNRDARMTLKYHVFYTALWTYCLMDSTYKICRVSGLSPDSVSWLLLCFSYEPGEWILPESSVGDQKPQNSPSHVRQLSYHKSALNSMQSHLKPYQTQVSFGILTLYVVGNCSNTSLDFSDKDQGDFGLDPEGPKHRILGDSR